jgi:hypothetical protein
MVPMHQDIMAVKGVDHRDGDGLNNQRNNLRTATKAENRSNAFNPHGKYSRWKGVTRVGLRWRVQISATRKHIGYFRWEYNAATAYNFAAEALYGEFAVFNVPAEQGFQVRATDPLIARYEMAPFELKGKKKE